MAASFKTTIKKTTTKAKKIAKPKKSPTKKSASKRVRKKQAFEKISPEKFFVLANGKSLDHYVTLAHTLENLEEDIIKHHVSEMHNDFSNWIHDVFSEEELAEKIKPITNPDKIRLIIYRHIIDKHLK